MFVVVDVGVIVIVDITDAFVATSVTPICFCIIIIIIILSF
jgi:hypothetical protein